VVHELASQALQTCLLLTIISIIGGFIRVFRAYLCLRKNGARLSHDLREAFRRSYVEQAVKANFFWRPQCVLAGMSANFLLLLVMRSSPAHQQDAGRVRAQALELWGTLLPERLVKEDLADYIERVEDMGRLGRRWAARQLTIRAMFWTGLNAIEYSSRHRPPAPPPCGRTSCPRAARALHRPRRSG
jgi:hypothetical protein